MTWFGWLFVALCALRVVVHIWMIDKPRPSLSRGDVMFTLLEMGLLAAGAAFVGTTH